MATEDPNVVQVSMNLLDTSVTPLHLVFDTVKSQAAADGVEVADSEIVGLLPLDVMVATTRAHVKARQLEAGQIVEARLLQALSGTEPLPRSSGQAGV